MDKERYCAEVRTSIVNIVPTDIRRLLSPATFIHHQAEILNIVRIFSDCTENQHFRPEADAINTKLRLGQR